MTSTQERIKQRRQYLKKKGATYAEMSLAALLLIPLIVIDFILVIFDVNAPMMSFSPTYTSDRPSQSETLVLVALSLLLGWITWRVVRRKIIWFPFGFSSYHLVLDGFRGEGA